VGGGVICSYFQLRPGRGVQEIVGPTGKKVSGTTGLRTKEGAKEKRGERFQRRDDEVKVGEKSPNESF